MDSDNRNCTQSRACARCRSYKFRLYHPGRLKYPLKQTKKRGDLSGFVRISWEEALNEISRKHKAITTKYGPEAFYLNYACGAYSSAWQGGGYNGIWQGRGSSDASKLIGGSLLYTSDYSFHQSSFAGTGYTGFAGSGGSAADIAGVVNNIVLWGSNALSTVNSSAYPEIRSVEDMKARGGKVWYIAPEFVDTGVTLADTWIQMKPYTDTAVILGMLHHLITNTVKEDGSIRSDIDSKLQLDLNYIDTMVYGFFDSPEYWINPSDGVISLSEEVGYTKINAVPAGRSLSAYIMGSDDRLKKVPYSGNYTANAFASAQPMRNAEVCSYVASRGEATRYQTKKDYLAPKTPEWAEKISGVPAETIRQLAELYVNPDNHPIYSEWCGAQQKQSEGVIHRLALQALFILTKTWGQTGDNLSRAFGGSYSGAVGSVGASVNRGTLPANPPTPTISCTVWHMGVKYAFQDKLEELGYTGKYIPDWKKADKDARIPYMDDGGAKSLVKWKRDTDKKLIKDANGYYEPERDASGNVIYSGIRFILNPGGNILLNQHMNSNDSKELFEALPLATTNPDDPESFCVVSFDNFLSPTPRWSDYVLPAATNWEQEDIISVTKGNGVYIPVVSNPPAESKSMWNFTIAWLKEYEKVDPSKAGIAKQFAGGVDGQQIEDLVKKSFAEVSRKIKLDVDKTGGNVTGVESVYNPYYGKTWEEFLENTYLPRTAAADTPTATITKSALRTNLETYLAGAMDAPFAKNVNNYKASVSSVTSGGFGNNFVDTSRAPVPSYRFHVYSDILVWKYEHRYEQYHGYLPAEQRGQANKDHEGDPMVFPIPMYFAYEDYFSEAYGVFDDKHSLPAKPLLLTTTHDRYRAHSSQAENPYLRELTHRTKGGGLYSGNDWKEYGLIGTGNGDTFPRLNGALQTNSKNASWSEIWINNEDASDRGVADGDLVLVENPIGAVRCIARVTTRCVKGMVGLHQGCWYDPDPSDGVDDGGNCNTLMASRPSRVDHGNGQQSAMVSITKVN